MRVLVIEDDDLARRTLSSVFQRGGHECTAVGSVSEAGDASPHEVAVVDYYLPDGDGVALAASLRQQWGPDVRILLLTGEALEGPPPPGVDLVLRKPVAAQVLLAAIHPGAM